MIFIYIFLALTAVLSFLIIFGSIASFFHADSSPLRSSELNCFQQPLADDYSANDDSELKKLRKEIKKVQKEFQHLSR